MVKDARAAARAGDIRALNQPIPTAVRVDDDGLPSALKLRNRWLTVESVVGRWRIDDEWWREEPVSRMYYGCLVDQGLQVTLFRDLLIGQWYQQRVDLP